MFARPGAERLEIRIVHVTVQVPGAGSEELDEPFAEKRQLPRRIAEAIERDQLVRSAHPFITDYFAAIEDSEASEVAERLSELLGRVDFVLGFSAAMQVHTGRGVVGAAWLLRP